MEQQRVEARTTTWEEKNVFRLSLFTARYSLFAFLCSPVILRAVPRIILVLSCFSWLSACLPGFESPAPAPVVTPPSCGNGRCEARGQENCINCPLDCPCCNAVLAITDEATLRDKVQNQDLAAGKSDGLFAEIKEGGYLELTMGRDIVDQVDSHNPLLKTPDFELIGEVTANSSPQPAGCPVVTATDGTVLVQVWDGQGWALAGLWTAGTPGTSAFDLACGAISQTLQIRLEARPGAQAKLDAIRALSCTE
jgi:hypothetical protein